MKKLKKNIFKVKKYFNPIISRTLISIVAVVETLLLIIFATFSWIETSSSLEIKNADDAQGHSMHLHVADALNYRAEFDTNSGGRSVCDLSTFFSDTYQFKFAKTSSSDGATFYFPKFNNTNSGDNSFVSKYRLGDTTDINTSYRSFDFVFKNDSDAYAYYGFGTNNFFVLHTDDNELNTKGANAFRFSVDINSAHRPRIFGMDGTQYQAISSISGGKTATTANTVTPVSGTSGNKAFTVHDNASTSVRVNVWFDIQAASLNNISASDIEKILSSKIDVNISFVKFSGTPDDNATQVRLIDNANIFGSSHPNFTLKNVYSLDSNNQKVYKDYTMKWDSTNGYYVDNTAGASGIDLDTYYLDDAFFYYSDTKQAYCMVTPNVSGTYVEFTTLSTTSLSASLAYTLGTWEDYTDVYLKFPSNTCTYYSTAAYNSQSSGVNYKIDNSSKKVYVNLGGTNAEKQTGTLTFDSANNAWHGVVPSSFVSSDLNFYYIPTSSYFDTGNATCKTISAPSPEVVNSKYMCTVVGFSDTDNKVGYGVWKDLSTIYLSQELMDMDISSSDRYKVGIPQNDGSTIYIYMQPTSSNMSCCACYPSGSLGNFDFYRNSTQVSPSPLSRGSKNTCYLIHNASDSSITASWNPVVLADGTAEHLINTILNENADNPEVSYSTDGGNQFTTLTKIDDYRWYATLDSSVSSVTLRWIAYSSTNTLWTHDVVDLSNGFVVTYTE